jgi:hypothetical protein
MIENREKRRRFAAMSDEVVGGARKLHNEKINNLCYFPSIIRMITSMRIT